MSEKKPDTPVVHLPWSSWQDITARLDALEAAVFKSPPKDQQSAVADVVNRALRDMPTAAPPPPAAAPATLDRLLQAADQVLDDMQDGTSCCPAARDALRDALCPFRPRLAEIDGVPPPAAPCADEVEVVARAFCVMSGSDPEYMGDTVPAWQAWTEEAEAALAALSPLRQAERERAWLAGAEATRSALAAVAEARGARALADAMRAFPLPPMGGV